MTRSGTVFLTVLANLVPLILSVVTFAVISVIVGSVYPNGKSVLVVIICFILVLNCYAGYMILIPPITSFGHVLSLTGLSHTHHHVSKNRVTCSQFFFPDISFSPWSLTRPISSHPCRGYVEDTGIYDVIQYIDTDIYL